MSTVNESTPLLSNGPRENTTGHHQSEDSIPARSRFILSCLKADVDAPLPLPSESGSEPVGLIILVYALHLLSDFIDESITDGTGSGISGSVGRENLGISIGERLENEIKRILDIWGGGQADDEHLYQALWMKWYLCQVRVSTLELLISQHNHKRSQSRILAHPVIKHFVWQLYKNGQSKFLNDRQRAKGLLHPLEAAITPRRAHVLHFCSFLAVWVTTMMTAIQPYTWSSRSSPKNGFSPVEIVWTVFISAAIIQVLQHPHRDRLIKYLYLLPSALSLVTQRTSYSSTFLALSIAPLTISFITPSPPSIPFLFSSLLPYSVKLWGIIRSGFRGWALIWPVILSTCVVFSISLNGDIFRGFFVIITTIAEPVEEGVAPYETRLAIFATLVILFYLAICLSISNMTNSHDRPNLEPHRELEVNTRSRAETVTGMIWLLGDLGHDYHWDEVDERILLPGVKHITPPPVPIPLNVLLVPLDLAVVALRLVDYSSLKESQIDFGRTVYRVRHSVAVLLIGIPCWLLSFVV